MSKYKAKDAGTVFKELLDESKTPLEDVSAKTSISLTELRNFISCSGAYLTAYLDSVLCKYLKIPQWTLWKVQVHYNKEIILEEQLIFKEERG